VFQQGVWFKGSFDTGLSLGIFLSQCDKFSSLRDKVRHQHFFTRETNVTSAIVSSRRAVIALRLDPQKCRVMPIGYVFLEICVRGPQFREMVAANLAAFTSASACCNRRPSQSE
jgi:hypothetical protein